MLTRIQHAAIISENFVREAKFYESVFGMKRSKPGSAEEQKAIRTNYAVSISDGYVGVTMIGRKPGYVPGRPHRGSTGRKGHRRPGAGQQPPRRAGRGGGSGAPDQVGLRRRTLDHHLPATSSHPPNRTVRTPP